MREGDSCRVEERGAVRLDLQRCVLRQLEEESKTIR